jgi:hypothetical protein
MHRTNETRKIRNIGTRSSFSAVNVHQTLITLPTRSIVIKIVDNVQQRNGMEKEWREKELRSLKIHDI